MITRLEAILANIEPRSMRGLEIGPLHNPVVTRADGEIYYVDHADTDGLRRKYADDAEVSEIVDVDFVWGDRPLADAVGAAAPFDYVVASHVIEHVPDPVGWLDEIAGVLRPGGIISLAIPDKRFCFDARRPTTDVSELVAAHLERRTRPTLAQTFDFWARYATVDAHDVWAGGAGHADGPIDVNGALARCRAALASDAYFDVHATTWTPSSFDGNLRALFELGWLEVCVASFTPTAIGALEFYVSLVRLPPGMAAEEKVACQLASLSAVNLSGAPSPAAFRVSQWERRVLETKRRAMNRARRSLSRRSPGTPSPDR